MLRNAWPRKLMVEGHVQCSSIHPFASKSSPFHGTAMFRRTMASSSSDTKLHELSSNSLRITRTASPKPLVPLKDLLFGRTFSDHMLTIHWDLKEGWHAPRIHPYEKLVLDPSASVFHYGMECFEGMKAYKDREGKLRLFRPEMNINRFFQSAQRLSLPTFDKKELLNCIKELVKLESKWVPMEKGYSLYIRPTLIGTQPTLGVGPSGQAQLFVITSPVGPYFPTGFKAVTLLAEEKYVRAWPGGTGANKVGANYAPTILPQLHANALGYQQLLWLFGESHDITEIGTMNCFVYWTNKDGIKELVTPALDGTILPGVTRDSILKLTKQWNEFRVTERKISIHEVIEACQENRLHEMFGAGTACIVCPIKGFVYSDKNFDVPLDPEDPSKEAGPLARRLNQTILSIQYGETPNPWSVVL